MSTDIDAWIGAEVERSFAGEPPLRDPQEYAARGRRAQRRRRAAAGILAAASVAFAAALAVSGSHLGGGAERGLEPAGAGHISPVRVTAPISVDPRQAEKCASGDVGGCEDDIGADDIRLDRSGRLLRGYSYARVTGAYYDVLPDTPDPDTRVGSSAAVELTVHGRTVWALLRLDVGANSSSLQFAAPDPTRTFDEWVADSVTSGAWFSYRPDPDGPGEGSTPR